jgi:hypothetical protein
MIKEYRPSNYADLNGNFAKYPITIDLRFVATATPYGAFETIIRMNGQSDTTTIHEEYSCFVRDWQSAKR